MPLQMPPAYLVDSDILDNQVVQRIALSIVIQAALDALDGDPGALSWFESTGLNWLQIMDIRFETEWIEQLHSGQIVSISYVTQST